MRPIRHCAILYVNLIRSIGTIPHDGRVINLRYISMYITQYLHTYTHTCTVGSYLIFTTRAVEIPNPERKYSLEFLFAVRTHDQTHSDSFVRVRTTTM